MALAQASLVEDVLSRQERAVLRSVYRASQLMEALVILQKVKSTSILDNKATPILATLANFDPSTIVKMEEYLALSVKNALVSTKIPALSGRTTSSSSKDTE